MTEPSENRSGNVRSDTASRRYSVEELDRIYTNLRSTFEAGTTRSLEYRRRQLIQLAKLIQDNIPALEDSLLQDLGKPRVETSGFELGGSVIACRSALESLEEWTKPDTPQLTDFRGQWSPTVYKVPKGLALIITPWNFPYVLAFGPLVGAIAAGCTCVVKGSELAPLTAQLLADLFPKYLDPFAYVYVNGAIPETTDLLALKWDHILFTGGKKVAHIIAQAAAKHLTPITLELGGKSPVVIAEDTDLEIAAKRLWYGKLQNAGQFCVSPDYVLVPRQLQDAFIAALLKTYHAFFPDGPFHADAQWGKIVNAQHHARLRDLLVRTKGEIVLGGEYDGDTRVVPTIVKNVKPDDALMEEEIFGPILPLIPVNNIDEALRIMNQQSVPLVAYAFTDNKEVQQKLLEGSKSGSFVLNDTTSQLAVHEIPFGGQGDSGFGAWGYKKSFDNFTHLRSSINVPIAVEPYLADRYRPYTQEKYEAMNGLVGLFGKLPEA